MTRATCDLPAGTVEQRRHGTCCFQQMPSILNIVTWVGLTDAHPESTAQRVQEGIFECRTRAGVHGRQRESGPRPTHFASFSRCSHH